MYFAIILCHIFFFFCYAAEKMSLIQTDGYCLKRVYRVCMAARLILSLYKVKKVHMCKAVVINVLPYNHRFMLDLFV